MSAPRLVGVLLAAGKGARMGRTKQLIEMPCAGDHTKPLVALAFDAIADACHQMIVVVDADRDRVIKALAPRSFVVVEALGTRQMSESALAGLRLAADRWPHDAVLLHLGDHPAVQPETVARLREESSRLSQRTIIPTSGGEGGHPILIPPAVVERLLSEDELGALRDFWRQHPDLCIRIEVEDAEITRDLDHPAELAKELQRRSNP